MKKRTKMRLSVLLTAANTFTLPLCYALPYARVARRLYHSGVAVAGYLGARLISRSRRMILTDRDLFPEGTVHLNGIKIYGEEIGKVVSFAASLARRSGSGVSNLFDDLLTSEGASLQKVDEFAYSDYGGWSAVIHGETTHLGTEKFLRRNNVAIPQGVKLKNGLFLAVDGRMIAAFAVKYPQVGATEWAIWAMSSVRLPRATSLIRFGRRLLSHGSILFAAWNVSMVTPFRRSLLSRR